MSKRKDLSGQKFGRLTVLRFDTVKNKRVYYHCLCECGKEKSILAQNFVGGKVRSCGCLRVANITSKQRSSDPIRVAAKKVWLARYSDGCSFDTFFKLAQQPCYYCNAQPSNHTYAYTGNHPTLKRSPDWAAQCHWIYNGLDRIDPNKNHDESNIVPCCIICNKAKLDMTIEEFKTWLHNIYKNFILLKDL